MTRREAHEAAADRALEALEPEARAALWLYIAERESVEDIAMCLGIPLGDVRSFVARGIRMLREAVRREGAGIEHGASLRAVFLELPEKDPPAELWEKTRRAADSILREHRARAEVWRERWSG